MRLFILILLVIPLVGIAQLKAPLGLTFGDNQITTLKKIEAKGGKKLAGSSADVLYLNGFRFGSEDVDMALLYFFGNQLYKVSLFITPEFHSQIFESFNEIAEKLTEKYGKPGADVEEYIYPYSKDDADKETPIALDKLKVFKGWQFEAAGTSDDRLTISITPKFDVLISYFNGDIGAVANARRDSKELEDF